MLVGVAPSLCGTPALPTPGLGPGVTPDSPVSSPPGLFLFPFTAGWGRGSFGRLGQGRPSRSHSWPGWRPHLSPAWLALQLHGLSTTRVAPGSGMPLLVGSLVTRGLLTSRQDMHTLVRPSTLWGPLSDHRPLSPVGTEVRTPSGAETSEKATVL